MHPLTTQSSYALSTLAISAAMLSAYAAFSLAERIERGRTFWSRRLWMTGAATVLGLGMWSLHFFGALQNPVPEETVYSLRLVVFALLVAISVSWMAFRLVTWEEASRTRLLSAAVVLAVGATAMHLIAIQALSATDVGGLRTGWAIAAVVVGSGLAYLSLWMTFAPLTDPSSEEWMRLGGGAAMGATLAILHFLVRRAAVVVPVPPDMVHGSARGNAVGEIALLVTVALILLVTLGTAAFDKRRYRELAALHAELANSQQALLRSEGQLREANALLSELSIRDGLTGLYNRRRFDQVFDMEWRRSQRSMRPLALLMIDVDCFKGLNDTYGHQRGDDCLREIARVLEEQPRRGHDMVARFGGEEFVVLLPGADVPGALRIGENIRRAVETQRLEHKRSAAGPYVTVSVGVSSRVPQVGETPETMLYDADMALYMAKQLGRNRVEIRDPVEVEV